MKKRLALLLLFFSFCYFLKAQKIQFGLTSALTFSNVSGNGMSSKSNSGIDVGGFATIPITETFSVQPEVLYNFMTVSRDDNFTTYYVDDSRPDSKASFKLSYVSIPVLINYQASKKIIVSAGPQYNILAYSNEDLMYDKQAFKNNDFGIRAGFKFAPSPTVNLFASYYYGLGNVNNIDTRYKWEIRQLQIGISVAIFTMH